VTTQLREDQRKLQGLTESLVRMAELPIEECDAEAVGQALQERQVILDRLQKADTSTLSAEERAPLIQTLEETLELDSGCIKSLHKHMNVLTKSSSSLTQARRAVSGYRPTATDDARPLRSIV